MAGETVTSTPEGMDHVRTMQNIIGNHLLDAIQQLTTTGDRLNPHNFDGGAAQKFYAEWPTTKRALNQALERLKMMSDDLMTVNTNVQTAGGN
ncbi:MAG TPA: WXG100 family type VII secretion target [Acidimicrobiales bacterium]